MQTQPRRLPTEPGPARPHKLHVARRAGHRAAVLLKIYDHCTGGQADAANRRITDTIGAQHAGQAPVTRQTATASRQAEAAGQEAGKPGGRSA